MKGLQIKVCGITDINQAVALEAMGVNYIGFIFYAPSKRYVLAKMELADLKIFTSSNAKKVGVFVNESIEGLFTIVNAAGLDMVQLHGDEDEAYFKAAKARLGSAVQLIKVFRVGDKMPAIEAYYDVADYFLFDTDSKMYGGTGAHFNWELLKGSAIQKPFFLSGGIGPNDIGGIEVMQQTKAGKTLLALDVNSQFEETPGVKNLEKIKTFINAFI
jgi:phosphoribosylanthranilate isomerase